MNNFWNFWIHIKNYLYVRGGLKNFRKTLVGHSTKKIVKHWVRKTKNTLVLSLEKFLGVNNLRLLACFRLKHKNNLFVLICDRLVDWPLAWKKSIIHYVSRDYLVSNECYLIAGKSRINDFTSLNHQKVAIWQSTDSLIAHDYNYTNN